jgi:hypothetical protein
MINLVTHTTKKAVRPIKRTANTQLQYDKRLLHHTPKTYTAFDGIITEIHNDTPSNHGGEVIYTATSSAVRNHDIMFHATARITGPTPHTDTDTNTQEDYRKRMDMLLSYTKLHCNSTCTVLNNPCDHIKTYPHPLMPNGTMPYTIWHGGLLNPILKKHRIKAMQKTHNERIIVTVTLEGIVAADGLATQHLHTINYDTAYEKNSTLYPSALELAVLGYLKERSIDKHIAAHTDYYFDECAENSYAQKFKQCIETEWSSATHSTDTGSRTLEHKELIKRHFPRNAYWASRFISPHEIRTGHRLMHHDIFNSPKIQDDACMSMTFNVVINK